MLTAAARATLAAFTAADALIAVDYLQEIEAMLPEVLLAYAGTPREFVDGLPHDAWWEWLHRTEPYNIQPTSKRPGDIDMARMVAHMEGKFRWEAVRDTLPDFNDVAAWRQAGGDVQAAYQLAIRDRKRRVLSLFPEVRLPCPECGGSGSVDGSISLGGQRLRGWQPCQRCYGGLLDPDNRGTVAAPDLIPPESQGVWPTAERPTPAEMDDIINRPPDHGEPWNFR